MLKPRKGSIALCSRGDVGMITSGTRIEVNYGKDKQLAWSGIHLSPKHLGKKWSSKEPKIIGHIDDLISSLK